MMAVGGNQSGCGKDAGEASAPSGSFCRATLVVCPLVAVTQWRQEIARFTEPGEFASSLSKKFLVAAMSEQPPGLVLPLLTGPIRSPSCGTFIPDAGSQMAGLSSFGEVPYWRLHFSVFKWEIGNHLFSERPISRKNVGQIGIN
jgi:hypothetical protein